MIYMVLSNIITVVLILLIVISPFIFAFILMLIFWKEYRDGIFGMFRNKEG